MPDKTKLPPLPEERDKRIWTTTITTVHGPVYLSDGHIFKRILWSLVMVCAFVYAGIIIRDSITEWEEQPLVMNFGLKSIPITDVPVSGARRMGKKVLSLSFAYYLINMSSPDTGQFTRNDAKAITLLFLNETEFFNFYKLLLDRHFPYGYLGAEYLVPVWHSCAGKQSLRLEQHMA